jgi:hypothetical protein
MLSICPLFNITSFQYNDIATLAELESDRAIVNISYIFLF